jgi:hypothetical protein
MDERKPPVWPWIAALLVGLPTLYGATFGPACWLVGRQVLPARHTSAAYRPLVRLACTDCGLSAKFLRWFARTGVYGEFGLINMGVWAGVMQLDDGTSSTIRLTGPLSE